MQLASYADLYPFARLDRDDGLLVVTLHTNDGPFVWSESAHRQLSELFIDISRDPENRALVLTGTGTEFCTAIDASSFGGYQTYKPDGFYKIHSEGRRLLSAFLDLEIPTVSAVNGPATFHGELPLLADVVVTTPHTVFQDRHYIEGKVPGDGAHIVWPALLGPNLGRSFLMTGAMIDAQRAHNLGVIHEIVEPESLMGRAIAIAKQLASAPPLVARYSRLLLTQELRKTFAAELSHGLGLEGSAMFADPSLPILSALRPQEGR